VQRQQLCSKGEGALWPPFLANGPAGPPPSAPRAASTPVAAAARASHCSGVRKMPALPRVPRQAGGASHKIVRCAHVIGLGQALPQQILLLEEDGRAFLSGGGHAVLVVRLADVHAPAALELAHLRAQR